MTEQLFPTNFYQSFSNENIYFVENSIKVYNERNNKHTEFFTFFMDGKDFKFHFVYEEGHKFDFAITDYGDLKDKDYKKACLLAKMLFPKMKEHLLKNPKVRMKIALTPEFHFWTCSNYDNPAEYTEHRRKVKAFYNPYYRIIYKIRKFLTMKG